MNALVTADTFLLVPGLATLGRKASTEGYMRF